MALTIQNIAQELSSLSNINPFCENDVFIFELDSTTCLVLESHSEKLYASLCCKVRSGDIKKAIMIKLLKLLHPAKMTHFFCNTFLLEDFVVISVCGSFQELQPKIIYQFQGLAAKCLNKAKGG